jgi:hypothetical protein
MYKTQDMIIAFIGNHVLEVFGGANLLFNFSAGFRLQV